MNACELTAAITAAANTIACKMDTDELTLLTKVTLPKIKKFPAVFCDRDIF